MNYKILSFVLFFLFYPLFSQVFAADCEKCINHSLLKTYEKVYECEGDWKCKWESSALIYSGCLVSDNMKCKEKAIQGLSSVLNYSYPPETKGLKYYRFTFDALEASSCNQDTKNFFHDSVIIFAWVCDEKYFKKALLKISTGCPTLMDSGKMLSAIKLGHDSSTIKYGFTEFFEEKTKRWKAAVERCKGDISLQSLESSKDR